MSLHQRILFALIMSFLMTNIMSFTLIAINAGFNSGYLAKVFKSVLIGWPIAAVSVFILVDHVKKLVLSITER